MGLIPEDKIAEVRDRTDIVAVVGDYVRLTKAGANHKGLCPFHNEKSPSFNVNGAKQFFHCFGCGKSGDVFSFMQEVEGKSFVEVARELARRAGVELPEPRSQRDMQHAREAESERAKLVRLHEVCAEFYRSELAAPVGEKARAYLASRGISDATAEAFSVGYAPAGWEALTKLMEQKRVPHELAERSGLVRRRDNARGLPAGAPPSKATHYDVFVDRIVYALTSPVGEVIGFGGRILEASENQPKYKNSPETVIYKKGENLFGLHKARHSIRKSGRALVVEGNFDVMTLHDRGIDITVAPQGTAMTEAQVKLLGRFAKEVILMLDADPAGRAATMKIIRLFVDAQLPVRVAQLRATDGKKVDPDDLARRDLPRLQSLIDNAVDGVELFFDQVASTAAPSVPGRVAAVEEAAPLLRAVADPLARDLYVARLGQLLGIDQGLVRRALRGGAAVAQPSADPVIPHKPRALTPICDKLLRVLAAQPSLIDKLPVAALAAIDDEELRALLDEAVHQRAFDTQAVVQKTPPALRDAVARALLSDEKFERQSDDGNAAAAVFDDVIRALTAPRDADSLEAACKAALARGDHERWRELSTQLRNLRRTHAKA